MILGVMALIAGVLVIVTALAWPPKIPIPAAAPADTQQDASRFAAMDNRRIDTRFGLVLIVSGSLLALPQLLGFNLAPTTFTILGLMLGFFMIAHSGYSKQLR